MNSTLSYELESRTSSLFGTLRTLCFTDGTKAACSAMLHLAEMLYPSTWTGNPRRYTILATRNVTADFTAACAMLDMDIAWLYPENTSLDDGIAANATPEAIYDAIEADMADAFYIKIPDMMGSSADLFGISEACHTRNIPFLVDNSEGAYLYFLSDGSHPMQLGADMCFDSASHLLPGLVGSAWLHIALGAADLYAARLQTREAGLSYSQVQQRLIANARVSAALFSSAEPSRDVLDSMDACITRLRADGDLVQSISATIARLDKLKEHLQKINVDVLESDPLRVVIDARSLGENGVSLKELYVLAGSPAPEPASVSEPPSGAGSESETASESSEPASEPGAASSAPTPAADDTAVPAPTPCVEAAYADNRYLIFLVSPGTAEQEIAGIFRIASRIKHAKDTDKPITWYLLTGNPEPEKPEGSEEENLDDFTDISELEAFEAETEEKTVDDFDIDEADDADKKAAAGENGADSASGDTEHALSEGSAAPGVVIEDVAAEITFPPQEMSDPKDLSLHPLKKVCSVREAMFGETVRVGTDEAVGRVCALPISCHPAWTVVAPGECIDEGTAAVIKSYGIGYATVRR